MASSINLSASLTVALKQIMTDEKSVDIQVALGEKPDANKNPVVKQETSFTQEFLFEEVIKKGVIVYGSKSQSDVDGGESMCATAVALVLISLLKGEVSFDIDSILDEAQTKYWALIHYLKGKNPAEDYFYGKHLTWLQDILPKDPPRLFPALQSIEHLTGKIRKFHKSKSYKSMIDELVLKIPRDETQVGGCLMIGVLFCAITVKKKEDFLEIHFFDSHKYTYLKNSAYHISFQGPNASKHLAKFLALRFSEYNDHDYHLDLVQLNEQLIDKSEIPPLNPEEQAAILCEILLKKESNKKEFLENELFPFLQKNLPDAFKQLTYLLNEDIKDLTKAILEMNPEQFQIIFTRFIEGLRKSEFVKDVEKIKKEILAIRDKLKSDKERYERKEIHLKKDRIEEIWNLCRLIESVRRKIDGSLFLPIRDEFLSLLLTHLYTSSSAWDNDLITVQHLFQARHLLYLISDSFKGETQKQWQEVSIKIENFIISEIQRDCHSENPNEKAINLFTRFSLEEGWLRTPLLKEILSFLKENLSDAYKEFCERFIPINMATAENGRNYEDIDTLLPIIMGISNNVRNNLLKLFVNRVLKKEIHKSILNDLEKDFSLWLSDSDQIAKYKYAKRMNKVIKRIREYEKQTYLDNENLLLFKKIESNFLEQSMTDFETLISLQKQSKDKISLKEIKKLGSVIEEGKGRFDRGLTQRWKALLNRIDSLIEIKEAQKEILVSSQESAVLRLIDKLCSNTEDSYPLNVEFIFRFLDVNHPAIFSNLLDLFTPINLMMMCLESFQKSFDSIVGTFLVAYPRIADFIYAVEVYDAENLFAKLEEIKDSDKFNQDSQFFKKTKNVTELHNLIMIIPQFIGSLILKNVVKEIIESKETNEKNSKILKIKDRNNPFKT